MKTFHEEIPDLCQDALTDQLFDEHSIFFDIETTGFSPANSTLYMIGCARRKSNRICIEQFFAEKPEEEAEILAMYQHRIVIIVIATSNEIYTHNNGYYSHTNKS